MAICQSPPCRRGGIHRTLPCGPAGDAGTSSMPPGWPPMPPSLSPELGRLLPLLPLGLLAGGLSGLLGIGGGLIFSPLLLLAGLEPHEALATSTVAIVPTTVGGTWAHVRQGLIPRADGVAIALGAVLAAGLFSRLGGSMRGWWLLALQALMYALLTASISPRPRALRQGRHADLPRRGLAAVGGVAGLASGLLGVGGGLVMVPLMVRGLGVPIHQAIRLSTLAVLASSATAASAFLMEGRADPAMGLVLGGTAAVAARWSAARLQRVSEGALARMLQGLTLTLAVGVGLRALLLARAPAPSGFRQGGPEGGIEFEAQNRRHLAKAVATVDTCLPGPVVEQEQTVGDPQLQGFRSEADPLGAVEAVRQQHRHVADQAAATALEQKGQPGMEGIGPEAPQTDLGDLRELAGVLGGPRPVQPQLHTTGPLQQPLGGKAGQRRQGSQVEAKDRLPAHLQGGKVGEGWGGHQEL